MKKLSRACKSGTRLCGPLMQALREGLAVWNRIPPPSQVLGMAHWSTLSHRQRRSRPRIDFDLQCPPKMTIGTMILQLQFLLVLFSCLTCDRKTTSAACFPQRGSRHSLHLMEQCSNRMKALTNLKNSQEAPYNHLKMTLCRRYVLFQSGRPPRSPRNRRVLPGARPANPQHLLYKMCQY